MKKVCGNEKSFIMKKTIVEIKVVENKDLINLQGQKELKGGEDTIL